MWVPMSGQMREAGVSAIQRSGGVGGAYVFPAPRRLGRPGSRFYARSLLQRAERVAELSPLEGGDFHLYRRAWATAWKHLPPTDVAQAGGWRSTATLTRYYLESDEQTLYQVVSEPREMAAKIGRL